MFSHGHARRAVLLLIVLAAAVLWTAGQGLRAAAIDRAEKSATPATTADKAAAGATVKDPPPATTAAPADKAVAETTVTEPAPATTAAAAPQSDTAKGKVTQDQVYVQKFKRVAPSLQKEAAKQSRLRGLKPGVAGLATIGTAAAAAPLPGTEGPGGIPHYFGPYGNWAFSPMPRGPIAVVTILDGGTGYRNPIIVIDDAYGTGASITIPTTAVSGVVQPPDPKKSLPAGANFTAPVATIIDDPALCGAGGQPACGTGALADAVIGGTLTGGIQKFVDSLPGLTPAGANNLGQYIPVGIAEPTTFSGQSADYYEIGLVEYSEQMHSALPSTRLRGYVQLETPGLLAVMASKGIVSKHVDVGGGKFAIDTPHYLGPVIVAQGRTHGIQVAGTDPGDPKPVRIKFYNLLPTGSGGNLFLPVDDTVPGSGAAPLGGTFTQNRATIHLHGNNTVWISDGNTHQWITPAGEGTSYPAGVSARNVPDMLDASGNVACAADPDPNNPLGPGGSGCMTFYYTNAQSARLQFYHDHAHGITRLNVYAGEAAGYVVTDAVEADMINGTNVTGVNPGLLRVLPPDNGGLGIPLIIQDKTFVDAETVYAQDPTWNWGTAGPGVANTGDLWYPHVYMTVQNPWDVTGTNAFGRWFYGPWFNPPTPVCVGGLPLGCIEKGVVPNPYYDPLNAPWEPPMMPGIPNPSVPGESFLDTPIVNGTAYPFLEVEPRAYRFRVLNAGNDRFLNLQLYVAADKTKPTTAGSDPSLAALCTGKVKVGNCTEVKMVPVSVAPANQYADTPSGIPDPTTAGPPWIQIGTEGGFMPAPVVVPQQPIGYNLDPAYFNFGIVNQHSLFLGSAERADVVVDFSAYAGQTLILYNDSPAPVPAGAAPYDNYTGDGNLMDSGGAPNTQPGYGPNTRTIMQIRVTKPLSTPTPNVTLANLEAVFAKTATKRGVFEVSQDPIIIPQAAYGSAYNNATFPSDASQYILDLGVTAKTFQPIDQNGALQPAVTIPLEMKAMHDEMGGVYDTMFGRMSGMLGLTNPTSPVHVLIPYPFSGPPTDIVKGSLEFTPIGQLVDGTQLWRIFHNGVDTHPIHTHLFHAQLINRVGQDGQVAPGAFPAGQAVDASDMGWKDTFRVNPLEITYLALRPTVPTPDQLPFEVPDSWRLLDPALPDGFPLPPPAPAGWFNPAGDPVSPVNHFVNFGWEYVWHCHILSHEEMDFMHSLVFAVPPNAPTDLTVNTATTPATVSWTDNSKKEAGFRLERATDATFQTGLATVGTLVGDTATGPKSLTDDLTLLANGSYWYRVWAIGHTVGDDLTPGFPTRSADSVSGSFAIQLGTAQTTPLSPTGLMATWGSGPQVSLTWTDNATNETGFVVERCAGVDCTSFAPITPPADPLTGTGPVTYVDTTVVSTEVYSYRVMAVNGTLLSGYSNIAANVADPAVPAPPTAFKAKSTTAGTVDLSWSQVLTANLVDFTIQRATNATFTRGVTSSTAARTATTATQTGLAPGTYYYRVRANSTGGSSAWTNASPLQTRVK